MKNPHGVEPTRYMKRKGSKYAIRCYPNDGPIFGYGTDIWIGNNCNRNDGGCICYGNGTSSYECNSPLKRSLFVNTAGPDECNDFKVSDYEVFTYN